MNDNNSEWFPEIVTDDDGAIVGEGMEVVDIHGDTYTLTEVNADDNGLYGVVEGRGSTWGGWETFDSDELNQFFRPRES